MQVEITGHHLNITDGLREHVERRLSRLDARRRPSPLHLHVVLNLDNKRHVCDLVARLDGDEFVARADDGDMYTAIDRAADKLARQLQDAKERKMTRRVRG